MNSKKMRSLSAFKMTQEQMEKSQGGLFYGHGAYWTKSVPFDETYQTGNIGTNVDGFNMGTDGYED